MWSSSIVEVEEASEARDARFRFGKRFGVGPLLEQRPDQTLGLPIRLWPIRPREPVADPKIVTGDGEVSAPIAAAVVGQDPLDRDAMGRIETPGPFEEASRRDRRFVGEFLSVGQPAVVVDREVDPVPADAAMPVDLDAGDPVTATRPDPTEHLRVEVDELTRPFALVADDRWPGLKSVESSQTLAPEDGVHRAVRESRLPSEDVRPHTQLAATGTQASDEVSRVTASLVVDGARAIAQGSHLGAVPPLRAGLAADASSSGRGRDRPARQDPIGQETPTVRSQSGIRMRHEGPFFDCGLQHQQPNDRGPQPVNNLIGN